MVTYLQPCSRKPGHCSLQELQGWPRSGSSDSGGCSGQGRGGADMGPSEAWGWRGRNHRLPLHPKARDCMLGPVPPVQCWAGWDSTRRAGEGDTTEVEAGQLRPLPYLPPFHGILLPRPASDTSHQPLSPPGLKHLPQNFSPLEHRVPNLGVPPRPHLCPFSTHKASSTPIPQHRSLRPHPYLRSPHEPFPSFQKLKSPSPKPWLHLFISKELRILLQDLRRP